MPFQSRWSRGRWCAVPLLVALTAPHGTVRAAKICIDPGHGGYDPGAVGCGLKESSVVLDVGLRLRDLLKKVNQQVIMTRTTDTFVSLSGRTAYANANGAHRFVSLHCNSAASVATGIETFCVSGATSTSTAYKLASTIQQQMLSTWPLTNRGVKKAGFYVLKYTSMAATLTEMGFINNCAKDAKYQASATHRQAAAKAHLFALQKHLGLPVVDPDKKPPATKGSLKGVVYEDTGKGSKDMSVRLLGAKVTLVGKGKAATVKPPDASWSFSLPGGTYTVAASLVGYASAKRSCTVQNGKTAWCSIGLKPKGGTLKGVVYKDTGKGSKDTSVRLPGAKVTLVGEGKDTAAKPADAAWSFTVPGGKHTVEASLAGYESAKRSCTVQDGKTTWCSIGLEEIPLDSGVSADAAPPPDAASGDGPVTTDGTAALDGSTPGGEPTERPVAEFGCSVGGARASGKSALVLLLLLLLGRLRSWRRRGVGAVALALLLPGCDEGQLRRSTSRSASPLQARQVDAFARLSAPRAVVSGGFVAPVLAPDGERVAFTRPGFDVLLVAELRGASAPRVVSRRSRAGYRPVWRADGEALGLRPADEPFGPDPLEAVAIDGRPLGSFSPDSPRVVQKDDCIFLVSDRSSRVMACGGGDRYFAPQLTGDGRHLVYCGLVTGLHVHRLGDRRTVSLGPGHQPAISADGRRLVFTRTEDDGERLTGAELWITDLTDPDYRTARLTRTPELEQHPSLSGDGKVLSYSAGGVIYAARLEEGAVPIPR